MGDIQYFKIVQALAVVLLAAAVLIYGLQYFRYRRIKKLYRADYARKSCMKSIGRLLPFMPRYKSKRYRRIEALLVDSGLRISVEGFYLVKTVLFIISLVFFISVQTTNTFMLYNGIINDLNLEKTLIDKAAAPAADALRLEREMLFYISDCLSGDEVTLEELSSRKSSDRYIEYIEAEISGRWSDLEEDTGVIAKRLYKKLVRIRTIEANYLIYLSSLTAAVIMYFMPNTAARLKLVLIEDKRDWEILNYIYVFSIFGRLPPFNIRSVLRNILAIADIYRPVIAEALNNIKSGMGEASFDNLLQRVDNQELCELLEFMRLSMNTGLLNIVDNIDEMAVNQLKWLEIKSIKRRKSKQVIAMVPVVTIMLIAMVYFSYSLSMLSNPMNFINK